MAVQLVGVGSFTQGTGAATIAMPAGVTAGNLLLLAVHSANETVATPSGWTLEDSIGTGTAAAIGSVACYLFSKIAGASEPSVVVADSGNVTGGAVVALSGALGVSAKAKSVQATAATAWTMPNITTPGEDNIVLWFVANDRDGNSTSNLTAFSTPSVSDETILLDQTNNQGVGGGVAIAISTTSLPVNTTVTGPSITSATSNTAAFITVAVRPDSISLAGSGTISNTSSGSITTAIRLSSSGTITHSTTGGLIIPMISLDGSGTFTIASSGSLSTQIRLSGSGSISNTVSAPQLNTAIRLAASGSFNSTTSAGLSTDIRLAGSSTISNSSSANIQTSILMTGTANIAYSASIPQLNTGILLAGSSTISNAAATPILGKLINLAGAAVHSYSANNPILGSLVELSGSGSFSTTTDANLQIGVRFSGNAQIGFGSYGLLIPDWINSNLIFVRENTPSFTVDRPLNSFASSSREASFSITRNIVFASDSRVYTAPVDHTYTFSSPILRLD